jgi:hypothetical protein
MARAADRGNRIRHSRVSAVADHPCPGLPGVSRASAFCIRPNYLEHHEQETKRKLAP